MISTATKIEDLTLQITEEIRVLERIPDDKLTWKPHPKSYSLGQLALHIASVPGNVAKAAAGHF